MKRQKLKHILISVLLCCCSCNQANAGHNLQEHEFNKIEIVKEATCKETGIKVSKCECGASIEEVIPMQAHSYEYEVIAEATCTNVKQEKGVCKNCGDIQIKNGSLVAHNYKWTTKVEPTCTTNEVLEGTCECGAKTLQEKAPLGHLFGEYETIVEPSTTNEGLAKAICANNCGESKTLKVLKTPTVSRKGIKVSWNKVEGAEGYYVYNQGKLLADVKDASFYNLPAIDNKIYSIEVEAYTNNELYFKNSKKSSKIQTIVSLGNNIQANAGTDFERFKDFDKPKQLTALLDADNIYANFSTGEVIALKDEKQNACVKLHPTANDSYATLTHAADVRTLKAGTYVISMDVKLGSEADGQLSFGFYDGVSWAPGYRTSLDISKANTQDWTNVFYEYTLSADKTGTYSNLDIGYCGVTNSTNNYVLIDNIKIIDKATEKDVNVDRNNNFEGFFSFSNPGWYNGGSGAGIVYVSKESVENSIMKTKTDDNKDTVAFKAYSSDQKGASVAFKGSKTIATEGDYKISIKVKLGPDAKNVGPIGFRMHSNTSSFKVVDHTFNGIENANGENWTVIDTVFNVKQTIAVEWINIEVWTFTHNDEIQSPDNYVLIDDLEIYKVITE